MSDAPLLYVAWDRDGSVHLPANLVGHLHDGVADYLADGDLAALAGLVVEVAGLFDDVECDEADVYRRLVAGRRAGAGRGAARRGLVGGVRPDPAGRDRRRTGTHQMTPVRAISFGAGKQSTALLLMALEGSIDADCAIFADTQDEPVAVYQHLWQMAERCATVGFPLYVTTAGRLSDEVAKPGTFISVPVFGRNQQGEDAQLRRQCSYQFKLRPMRAFMKRRLAPGQTLEFLIGISTDEIGRAKPSGRKWVTNLHPLLIDKRMSRYDCVRYCAERGVYPPRSACVFCPFRTDDEWRDLTNDEFEAACQFDDALRVSGGHGGRYGEELFVHDSMVPLRLVDFATVEDRGQGALFARGDCMGLCGV